MRAVLALDGYDSQKHSGIISEFRRLYKNRNKHTKTLPVYRLSPRINRECHFSPHGVLAFEAEIVSDHRDKLRIGGFSLDAAHGVAEEPLQGLHIAAVPGHLDGVADFGTFVPKK